MSSKNFSWRRFPLLVMALAAILMAAIYWFLLASDRYVSEARIVLQRSDLSSGQAMDFASLLGGTGGSRADQLLLRDHLMSLDMLRKLDGKLKVKQHFSSQGDWLSRLRADDVSAEKFHDYFKSRVSVELDEFAGVLVIKAQGYTPQMAQAIAQSLLTEGETYMNAMGHALAHEQVRFLERQVQDLATRVKATRSAVLAYQNSKGMLSPQATAENMAGIVAKLESQLTELQTRRTGLLAYLQPNAPQVVELNQQITAVEQQLTQERARLAAPEGSPINAKVAEFQQLQHDAEFAQQVLNTALVALEKGRVDATRTLKKVAVLQAPNLPEDALQPRRVYNTVVFAIVALLLAGIMHLLMAIVRDHQD